MTTIFDYLRFKGVKKSTLWSISQTLKLKTKPGQCLLKNDIHRFVLNTYSTISDLYWRTDIFGKNIWCYQCCDANILCLPVFIFWFSVWHQKISFTTTSLSSKSPCTIISILWPMGPKIILFKLIFFLFWGGGALAKNLNIRHATPVKH